MKRYEMIRELFSSCSGMAVPIVEEIEAEDPIEYLRDSACLLPGSEWTCTPAPDGAVIDVFVKGIRSRYTFTEL